PSRSILTLSFAKNKLPDSSPGPARRSRSERRMATEEEESETQTDGTLPDLRMYAGTRRGGDRRRNVGADTIIPDPLTNILRPSHGNLPAFYQVTPPQPFSPGRIVNQLPRTYASRTSEFGCYVARTRKRP